ncbi:MAG: hypothetical protein ACRDO0_18875 [Nocardioidaceae bacterium]
MTQPYDHTPDDAWPSDDTPDAADTVDATEAVEHQPEPEAHPEPEAGPEPQPQHRPEPQSFGDARVDRAVERLAELDERAVGDHVEVFDDIHGRLRDALEEAAVDTSPP